MSWTGAMTALAANLTTGAAAIADPITLVRAGMPETITVDQIAYWASGSRDSQTGGNTLTKVNRERGVQVVAYLRGSMRASVADETLELRLIELEGQLLVALWADADLGGNAIGITIDEITYDWAVVGDQVARTLQFIVWVDLAELATISL